MRHAGTGRDGGRGGGGGSSGEEWKGAALYEVVVVAITLACCHNLARSGRALEYRWFFYITFSSLLQLERGHDGIES